MKPDFKSYEVEFQLKYARWSSPTWRYYLEKSVLPFMSRRRNSNPQVDEKVLDAYVRLGAEGIGNGSLSPRVRNLFFLFFIEKLPFFLGKLEPIDQLQVLTQVFNLHEKVLLGPGWLESLLVYQLSSLEDLSQLDLRMDAIQELLAPPVQSTSLGLKEATGPSIYRTETFGYFLPHRVRFLAPPLIEVLGQTPRGDVKAFIYVPQEKKEVLNFQVLSHSIDPVDQVNSSEGVKFFESLTFKLVPQSFAASSLSACAVFRDSQNIWVWNKKGNECV